MRADNTDLDLVRHGVSCATVLEWLPPPWRLDRKGSTRRALKYRRGAGEVLIVNHDGRGWWDPHSTCKGDVFDLLRYLDPRLTFGQACQVLRGFIGIAPAFPAAWHRCQRSRPDRSLSERWQARSRLSPGCRTWRYLTGERRLPPSVLAAADGADVLREGPYGSAWFAHRDEDGLLTHIEIRGPDFKGSLRGGTKTLFRLAGSPPATRVAITEAPIDALSLATLEGLRADTLYAATGGGMGPATLRAIERLLAMIAPAPDAVLVGATDANAAGERFAVRHAGLAAAAGVAFARLRPVSGGDWNDVLKQGRGP